MSQQECYVLHEGKDPVHSVHFCIIIPCKNVFIAEQIRHPINTVQWKKNIFWNVKTNNFKITEKYNKYSRQSLLMDMVVNLHFGWVLYSS